MDQIARWTAYELTFTSEQERSDPFWDIDLRLELTSPSGRTVTLDGFWDGGRTWRVRVDISDFPAIRGRFSLVIMDGEIALFKLLNCHF